MNGTKQCCTWAALVCCCGISISSVMADEFINLRFRGIDVNKAATQHVPVPAAFGRFNWSSLPTPSLDNKSESSQAFRFKLDVISDSLSEIWEFGPVLQYRMAPDETRNNHVNEIYPDRYASVEAGAYVGLRSGPWRANLTLAAGNLSDGYTGYLTDFEGSYRLSLSSNLSFTLGANLSYADTGYMEAYSGLGRDTAARNTNQTFSNNSGFTDWGLKLGADYSVSKRWGLFGTVTYDRQVSNIQDRQLPSDQRSDSQYGATLSITYQF